MPIEGISIDGGREVKLLVKKSSIRFANNGFGIYSKLSIFHDDELEDKVTYFMRNAGYTGIFEIEFIIDEDGTTYFMEINFRNTMFNHACADYGVNILQLFAHSALNNHIDQIDDKSANRKHTVMYEFDDLKLSVIQNRLSIWRWLKDFISTDSFLYIDKRDMAPFWSLLRHKITDKLKNR